MTPIVKKIVITWQVVTFTAKTFLILGKITKFHTHSLSSSKFIIKNVARRVICSRLVEIGLTNYATRLSLYHMFFI